jgi:hypothetical protein
MKPTVFLTIFMCLTATSRSAANQALPPTATNSADSTATVIPASDIKWVPVRPGQDTSILWGDPRNGPYGRFNRFAAGFDDRAHFHTRDLRSVIISGILDRTGHKTPDKLEVKAAVTSGAA